MQHNRLVITLDEGEMRELQRLSRLNMRPLRDQARFILAGVLGIIDHAPRTQMRPHGMTHNPPERRQTKTPTHQLSTANVLASDEPTREGRFRDSLQQS